LKEEDESMKTRLVGIKLPAGVNVTIYNPYEEIALHKGEISPLTIQLEVPEKVTDEIRQKLAILLEML
jgi:hypothetical protein